MAKTNPKKFPVPKMTRKVSEVLPGERFFIGEELEGENKYREVFYLRLADDPPAKYKNSVRVIRTNLVQDDCDTVGKVIPRIYKGPPLLELPSQEVIDKRSKDPSLEMNGNYMCYSIEDSLFYKGDYNQEIPVKLDTFAEDLTNEIKSRMSLNQEKTHRLLELLKTF